MSVLLDASAVLALFWGEAGSRMVSRHLGSAAISVVNLVEVYSKIMERGQDADTVRQMFAHLSIAILPFDEQDAFLAGRLRLQTRSHGLSLGDRACLATGMRGKYEILTADKAWKELDLGANITLIR